MTIEIGHKKDILLEEIFSVLSSIMGEEVIEPFTVKTVSGQAVISIPVHLSLVNIHSLPEDLKSRLTVSFRDNSTVIQIN